MKKAVAAISTSSTAKREKKRRKEKSKFKEKKNERKYRTSIRLTRLILLFHPIKSVNTMANVGAVSIHFLNNRSIKSISFIRIMAHH
jgi:hypothetical protein